MRSAIHSHACGKPLRDSLKAGMAAADRKGGQLSVALHLADDIELGVMESLVGCGHAAEGPSAVDAGRRCIEQCRVVSLDRLNGRERAAGKLALGDGGKIRRHRLDVSRVETKVGHGVWLPSV